MMAQEHVGHGPSLAFGYAIRRIEEQKLQAIWHDIRRLKGQLARMHMGHGKRVGM